MGRRADAAGAVLVRRPDRRAPPGDPRRELVRRRDRAADGAREPGPGPATRPRRARAPRPRVLPGGAGLLAPRAGARGRGRPRRRDAAEPRLLGRAGPPRARAAAPAAGAGAADGGRGAGGALARRAAALRADD